MKNGGLSFLEEKTIGLALTQEQKHSISIFVIIVTTIKRRECPCYLFVIQIAQHVVGLKKT